MAESVYNAIVKLNKMYGEIGVASINVLQLIAGI